MSKKTNKSLYKRILKTKNYFKICKNFKNHILTKKKKNRKRKLKKKIFYVKSKIKL
ncbi:50S ribosomal protein L35 [Candidatus Vidania fulgoroideorum]